MSVCVCASRILVVSLGETQKIAPNDRHFSIYTGTPGTCAVQKLDYLQLLVVEAVSEAFGRAWDGITATGVRIKRAGADAGAAAAAEAARVAEETGVQCASHQSSTCSLGTLR